MVVVCGVVLNVQYVLKKVYSQKTFINTVSTCVENYTCYWCYYYNSNCSILYLSLLTSKCNKVKIKGQFFATNIVDYGPELLKLYENVTGVCF